jgi:carboxylesterase type B
MMAYGASRPIPFQQGICESQALEPGITGNFTNDAMQLMVDAVGCNTSSLDSVETIACLRSLDGDTLLNASLATYNDDMYHNLGDIWLPTVDGDFLPAAPSELIQTGRLPKVTAMIGWCDDDTTLFTDTSIITANDTRTWLQAYVPDVTPANIDALLSLYPVSDFAPNEGAGLSAEFYRAARVVRDIIMTCQPIHYGSAFAAAQGGDNVYLYDWNQTLLGPLLEAADNLTGLGSIHTSEFAYIFGNLSHYNISGYPFEPTDADWALEARGSRSWATFATTGRPGATGLGTFQGFEPAYSSDGNLTKIFVVGGEFEGSSAVDGPGATAATAAQKLRERCAFINSKEMIGQLKY